MTSIFVAKLDFGVTSEDLKKAFQEYGAVLKATVATDRETGRSKGFAFVEMSSDGEAQAAIDKFNGQDFEGRRLTVNEARPQPPRENRGPRPSRY